MVNLITPRILHDHPLDPEHSSEPCSFHFDDYANTLARLIADPNSLTPMVIGISGKWGSGKTTLLKRIRAKLDRTRLRTENDPNHIGSYFGNDPESAFRQCRTVWFSAWKYANEDALLVALVRVIVQAMSEDDIVSRLLAKVLDPSYPRRDVVATVLSWFAIKTPLVEIRPDLNKYKAETPFSEKVALLDQFSDTFDHLTAAWVHRSLDIEKIDPERGVLVVFIDDLDRCLPDKAVQVLEAMKLFLDHAGIIYVLAADEDTIRSAIEAHYESKKIIGQQASDYLEKIFQIRFSLPPLSNEQLKLYLTDCLGGVDSDILESLDLIIAGAEANPRQIKTFLNYINLGWAIFKNCGGARGIERADFIRWLVLARVGPSFCDRVRDLPKDRRLDFILDAIRWSHDPNCKTSEYKDWEGFEHRRIRRVLQYIEFSSTLSSDVLENLIFWSSSSMARADSMGLGNPPPQQMQRIPVNFLARDNWINIDSGKFVMGSRNENELAQDNEFPQCTVEIPYSYSISRYCMTNSAFAEYIQETGRDLRIGENELPNNPVTNISWYDTQEFCRWLTKKLRQEGILTLTEVLRLPTEAEWEKAARGEYGKEWPWGNQWNPGNCNNWENGARTTTPVDAFSPAGDSPYGVADMVGNVWEWCQSKFMPYPYDSNDGREDMEGNEKRVLRGGAFNHDRQIVRCAFRKGNAPRDTDLNVGFRPVVVNVEG